MTSQTIAATLAALVACSAPRVHAPTAAHALVDEPVHEIALVPQPAIVTTIQATAIDLGASLGAAIGTLVATTQIYDVDVIGPPYARYLGRGDRMTVEVGLPIRRVPESAPDGDVRIGELPGGTAVRAMHLGPHARLGDAYAQLDRWIASHRRREDGPRWEVYLTDPTTVPDEASQRTVVFAPITPVAPTGKATR